MCGHDVTTTIYSYRRQDKPYKTLIIVKLVLRYKRKEIAGHGENENDIPYWLYCIILFDTYLLWLQL